MRKFRDFDGDNALFNEDFLNQFNQMRGLCKSCGRPVDKHYYQYCRHCYFIIMEQSQQNEDNFSL